jgi:type IV secretion system protein TrbL
MFAIYLTMIGVAHAQAQNCDTAAAQTAIQAFVDAQKAFADAVEDEAKGNCDDCRVDELRDAMTTAQTNMTTALDNLRAQGCEAPNAPGEDGCGVRATVAGQTASFCFFNQFDDEAKTQSGTWMGTIRDLGRNTFFILATLELCWAAVIWALEKDDMNSLATELVQKIMFISFFLAVLNNATVWIPSIIQTLSAVGREVINTAAAVPDKTPITVDKVIAMGFAVVKAIWLPVQGMDVLEVFLALPKIFVAIFVTIVVVVAYFIAAAQLLCLNIESYVLLAAGAILLGLGSSRWTNEYVTKYFTYTLNVGIRLLTIVLILALTQTFVNNMGQFRFEFPELFRMMAMAIMTMLLAVKAPEMASALMSGAIGFSAGSAVSSARSVTSGVSAAAGAVAGTLGAVAGAAKGANNLYKLGKNSAELAKLEGKSASGAFVGALAKEGGRSVLNAARGKDGNYNGKDKKGNDKRVDGKGAIDRANKSVKKKISEKKNEGGGSAEGSSSSESSSSSSSSSSGSSE